MPGMFSRSAAAVGLAALLGGTPASADQQRVLFIGNSFSFVSGGVWTYYKQIAEACIPGLQVTTTFKGEGAATLKETARDPAVQALVEAGDYDILVIQDQSELAEDATEAVRTFYAPQVAKHNARLALYQTWATPDADGGNLTQGTMVRQHYYEGLKQTAQMVGAQVMTARGGEAFLKVLGDNGYDWEMPGFMALLSGDYDHPSPMGLNLVAWTMVMRFNKDRFGPQGCDFNKAPQVQGETWDVKKRYHEIGCQLAGICPPTPPASSNQNLCTAAQKIQGRWMSKKGVSQIECESLRNQGDYYLLPDCTYEETWEVSGTTIIQTSRGETFIHHIRINDMTGMCIVKLIPAYTYLSMVTDSKLQWNNCDVWTRYDSGQSATPNECWCSHTDTYKDYEGDTCAAYEPGGKKAGDAYCYAEGQQHVSRFVMMKTWQSCPGCRKCSPPPPRGVTHRRLEQQPQVIV